jgi:hypothetical protein
MPVKVHVDCEAVSPALKYALLVGTWAPGRIRGWVEASQLSYEDIEAIWQQHRDELEREARASGFNACGPDADPPRRSAARDEWARAFFAEWGY